MKTARLCAASIWSSAINARLPSRKAGSSPRRGRSTCPILQLPIQRTGSRPASVSSSSAKAMPARRCASPSVPESRSMADTQQQSEGKKPKQPQGAPKGAKDGGAPKGGEPKVKKPRERSDYVARMKTHYEQGIRGELSKKIGYTNRMQVPTITKVVLNMGIGEGVADRKKVDNAAGDLSLIAGQKAVITKSRKSIATYKLRDGQAIGCKVTLRKARMYDFLDRLVTIALPRVRDFRGLNPKSFDGRGNYSLGLKEQIVFPEINYDEIDKVRGMDIIVTTTAKTDEEARELLRLFNFPFPAETEAKQAA